jgi:5'-nucleotidase
MRAFGSSGLRLAKGPAAGGIMTEPIEDRLVVAIASSALFDLSESDRVFREKGSQTYRDYQRAHRHTPLDKGIAFPFIRRFLGFNQRFPDARPVEVILLSRNSVETGQRVFESIDHHGLDITRAAFLEGRSPYPYIGAFNAALFLTAHEPDVVAAVDWGYPAGLVMHSQVEDIADDHELRIAFDFDGVIVDDDAEAVFQQGLDAFTQYETDRVDEPHRPGPLAMLFKKLAMLQQLEDNAEAANPDYARTLRTAIVTARGAPTHNRLVTTLQSWGVSANETFLMGGIEKHRILETFRPHIFFDDKCMCLSESRIRARSIQKNEEA